MQRGQLRARVQAQLVGEPVPQLLEAVQGLRPSGRPGSSARMCAARSRSRYGCRPPCSPSSPTSSRARPGPAGPRRTPPRAASRCSSHRATAARANSSSAKSASAGPRHKRQRLGQQPGPASAGRRPPAPAGPGSRTVPRPPRPARPAARTRAAADATSSRPPGSAPAKALRSCETRTWSAAVGSAGAASPHRSSTSRSADTGRPSWTSRSASSARTLRPGIVTGSPWSVHTASGPSTPNRTTQGYERQLMRTAGMP